MTKVDSLIKYLMQQSYQLSPVRLTLHNYLKFLLDPEEEFSIKIIETFIADCLEYPHWQQNKKQLTEELQVCLQEFSIENQVPLDLTIIKWPKEYQIIEIESWKDIHEIGSAFIDLNTEKDDKFKLIIDQNKKILAIILNSQGELDVRVFDKKFTIRRGFLEPLKKYNTLQYKANLELKEGSRHRLELAPYVLGSFSLKDGKVNGNITRGYIFQRLQEIQGEALHQLPKLFCAVKHLEQFFVHRSTDPYYRSLISSLEGLINMVKLGHKESFHESLEKLAQAQVALESIFVGDRVLELLIKELQHTLESSSTVIRI